MGGQGSQQYPGFIWVGDKESSGCSASHCLKETFPIERMLFLL